MTKWMVLLVAWSFATTSWADILQFSGEGERYDLGLELEGRAAKVYLADKVTNAPVIGKLVEFVPHEDGDEIKFTEMNPGVYVAFMNDEGNPAGQIVVNYEKPDEDTIDLEQPGHEGREHDDEGHEDHADHADHEEGDEDHAAHDDEEGAAHKDDHDDHDHGVMGELEHMIEGRGLWLGLLGGLCLFFVGWFMGRGQGRKTAAAVLFVIGGLSLGVSDEGRAGAGHAHAEVGIGTPGEGTTVRITKRSQFLIGLTAQEAKVTSVANVFRTFGHIVAKPQLDARIRAARDGVLRGIAEDIWGKSVKRGQVVARIDAVGLVNIKSPISGNVIHATGVSGARVSAGEEIMRIVDTSKLWVDAEVFQRDLRNVKKATSVYVTIESGDELATRKARLVGAQTVVDEHTMAGKIFLEIDNTDGTFSIGNTVQVHFKLEDDAVDGVMLPHSAVLHRGAETIVYLKTGAESFEPRPVAYQPGPEPGTVVVTQGLTSGDRVVVSGNYQLLVGAK